VERAVYFAMAELGDPVFDCLQVEAVRMTDDGCLCVELALDPHEDVDLEGARERLESVRGFLRAEVAAAIHRRRTPPLELVLRPGEAEPRDG
jgi:ribosome-binding factor A